jgi:hypothetical protein
MPTERDDLVSALAYAIARNRGLLPKPGRRVTGWGPAIDEYGILARALVEHLELSRYVITRKTAAPHPSTNGHLNSVSRRSQAESGGEQEHGLPTHDGADP